MNNRKQKVIETAHQLFIEKGYNATSVQDILDGSGISKGTFYNYFPSKSELFIAIFRSLYKKINDEREAVLIGKELTDIEGFIEQLEIQMIFNKQSNMLILIEEVLVSNDEELKKFIKRIQLLSLRWTYGRFIDIFGESKKPYLLDLAAIFLGMMIQMNHYNQLAQAVGSAEKNIIRYCIDRIIQILNEISTSGVQILDPELIDTWLPNFRNHHHQCHNDLLQSILALKKATNKTFCGSNQREQALELIDFIQDELLQSTKPRRFLLDSTIQTLTSLYPAQAKETIDHFRANINVCLGQLDNDI